MGLSTNYLGLNVESLEKLGGIHTASEIVQQPALWQKVWDTVNHEQSLLESFFTKSVKGCGRIILTGAGTSSFIGLTLRSVFQRETGILTESIPTTDLVSHPTDYFQPSVPTLIVSFARSGNSPESLAALELADKVCDQCYHLIITCNHDGKLANYVTRNKKYVFKLPPESNDKSLAMTSSYSGMLLAGILIAGIRNLAATREATRTIVRYAQTVLDNHLGILKDISKKDFNRIVFLGSGPNYGVACESQLKVQEMTDGQVIGKHDSFLGFRHGPKALIDGKTLVVYIFSNDAYSRQYERDLVESMKIGRRPLFQIGIMESPMPELTLDYALCFADKKSVREDFLSVCAVLPAQIIGFFKSVDLGLKPDSPSVSGAISRVVEGVNIYGMTDKPVRPPGAAAGLKTNTIDQQRHYTGSPLL